MNKQGKVDEAMSSLEVAKRLVQEKYKVSQWAHSGGGRWFQYNTDPGTARPFSIQLFLNELDEVRIKASSMPVIGSMASLELGEFSYPNKSFDLQMRLFKDMVECLYDEFKEE